MKIQFIGIGGVGISALAKWMLSKGHEISGINDSESLKTLGELYDKGVEIKIGTDKELLDKEADLYVYSVAWLERAPEMMELALESGKAKSYFEALGHFASEMEVIAVSGTHGKTTTTAMLHSILDAHDFDHTTIVGSVLASEGSNFIASKNKSDFLLVEACEYRRHFLHFEPSVLVVTNIEAEHLDYYKDLDDVKSAFRELARQSKSGARIVANLKDENVSSALEGISKELIDYNAFLSDVPSLSLPGEHNALNAAAALAAAAAVLKEKFSLKKAQAALAEFKGTWRRFEKLGKLQSGATLVSDYAHHPSEIKATLKATKSFMQKRDRAGEIFAIFEPHTYSRAKALADEFAESFGEAAKVYVLPIYAAREKEIPGVSSGFLAEKINAKTHNAEAVDFEKAVQEILKISKSGDLVLGLGAGDIDQKLRNLIKK